MSGSPARRTVTIDGAGNTSSIGIGASDRLAPPADTRKCFERITAAGNPDAIRWVALENTPHMFERRPNGPGYSGSAVEASKTEIDAFLRTQRLVR